MSLVIRDAELEELESLSELCLRSKAVWGYDQTFLEACRDELTFHPEDLYSTHIAVADTDGGVAGVVLGSKDHLGRLAAEGLAQNRGPPRGDIGFVRIELVWIYGALNNRLA